MIKPDLSTEESRSFWDFVYKAAKEVDRWPWWMKGYPRCGETWRETERQCDLSEGHKGKCRFK